MSRLNARQTAVFAAIAAFAVTGAILATRAESQPIGPDRSDRRNGHDGSKNRTGHVGRATGDRTVR